MRKVNDRLAMIADQLLDDPEADVWQFLAVAACVQLAQVGGLLAAIVEVLSEPEGPPAEGEEAGR